jgi:hypothetical protein
VASGELANHTDDEYMDTWRKVLRRTVYVNDLSAITRAVKKVEVVEEGQYLILKKTNRINVLRDVSHSEARGDHTICSTCRINLTPKEPYINVNSVYMCKHCVEKAWNELSIKYERHPLAEGITTAWTMEMVTREV